MPKNKRKKHTKTKEQTPLTPATIQREIERDKSENALDLAKRYMKENPGPEAEALLADAYRLRISKLQQSKLVQDAKNLIETAKNKCPNHKELFDSLQQETYHFPLSRTEVESIARLLESQTLTDDVASRYADILSKGLGNPAHLAECSLLPDDSPLKKEAILIRGAFKAVASDAPEEEQAQRLRDLSLVSRRSPLAPWCMFIRALDAFHRRDDDDALRLLERIPNHSTLSFAKIVLQSKITEAPKPEKLATRSTRELWKSFLPETLTSLLDDTHIAIQQNRPQQLIGLIQRLFDTRWELPPFVVREIVRYFYRLFTREGIYNTKAIALIKNAMQPYFGEKTRLYYDLILYEEFIYDDIPDLRKNTYDIFKKYSDQLNPKQSAAIWARAGKKATKLEEIDAGSSPFMYFGRKFKDSIYEYSIAFYEKAIDLHPLPRYFAPLVSLLKKDDRKPREIEEVLHKWHITNPHDVSPLIQLFENTEKRNTLTKSLKYLEQAEQLDRLNPQVRNARHRLVWRLIQQHLRQGKPHLVERDLRQIDRTDLTPDKKALFDAVERLLAILRDEPDPGAGEDASLFSDIVLRHLDCRLELKLNKRLPALIDIETPRQLEAYYNFEDALISVGDLPDLPKKWVDRLPDWITKMESISDDLLLRISKTILNHGTKSIVISATGRGLKEDGPRLHEFLYYRSRALLSHGFSLDNHPENCLLAVYTLARAKGDYNMAQLAENDIRRLRNPRSFLFESKVEITIEELTEYQIRSIIQKERKRKVKQSRTKTSAKRNKRSDESTIISGIEAMTAAEEDEIADRLGDYRQKPGATVTEDDDIDDMQSTFWDSD